MMNFAHGGGWGSNGFGHMGMRGFGGGLGGIFGWIMMLLFAGLVITGIVYLIKNMNKNSDSGRNNSNYRQIDYKKEDSARAIARERYAKGEITKDELNEILANLDR